MTNLSWSPDGRHLAYSGIEQGVDDLYLYELDGGRVTKLTDDRYADLQPSWSADGKSLLFVSDRGEGADLAELQYAPLGLFVLDVASRQVRALPRLGSGSQIDPHYSRRRQVDLLPRRPRRGERRLPHAGRGRRGGAAHPHRHRRRPASPTSRRL